jgi:ankyrin repeat protein
VQKLIKGRALVNIPDWSPLMYAAYNGHAPVVNYLLENGAEVNAQASNGFTALIAAAKGGYENIVITLLKRGAKPNLVTDRGETAMDFALRTDNTDIYDRLRAVGGLSGQAISSSLAK